MLETVLVVLALLLVGALSWVVSVKASYARLNGIAEASWLAVQAELRRRHVLVDELVALAAPRGAVPPVVTAVAEARDAAAAASGPAATGHAEQALNDALRELFAAAPGLPLLRGAGDLHHLEQRLADCEDRIATGRRYYNSGVRVYGERLVAWPYLLLRGGRTAREYLELRDPEVRGAAAGGGLFDPLDPPGLPEPEQP